MLNTEHTKMLHMTCPHVHLQDCTRSHTSLFLTSTLDLSTFSQISRMQPICRFCTVKLLVQPAISNRKFRSMSMPRSVRSTSG